MKASLRDRGEGLKTQNFIIEFPIIIFLLLEPVGLGHEVHAVLVVGGALPDQLGVHGAPVRVGHVIIPAVIPLPLIL